MAVAPTALSRSGNEMAVPGRRNGMMGDDDDDNNDIEDGLFEEGLIAEPDFQDAPLHLRHLAFASQNGDLPALRLALDNLEGNIDQPIEDGDTALHLACLYGHLPCVQLLLERGASPEAKDEDGAIPLHDACAGGYYEIVQLLIRRASDSESLRSMLETFDVEGDTPLHHAARGEHLDVIRLLLAHGASPTKKNIYDKIPAELAEPETEIRTILEDAANAMHPSHS